MIGEKFPEVISGEDKKLLTRIRPKLMKYIDLQSSPLLVELAARDGLTKQEKEVIMVR